LILDPGLDNSVLEPGLELVWALEPGLDDSLDPKSRKLGAAPGAAPPSIAHSPVDLRGTTGRVTVVVAPGLEDDELDDAGWGTAVDER
jgi:hypothetical protein